MSSSDASTATIGQAPAFSVKVRGESLYDKVTSILMAVVIGALLAVAWLLLIYATNNAYASRVTAPLEIIEVFGGGGGSPEGTEGSTEKIDVAGGAAGPQGPEKEGGGGHVEGPPRAGNPAPPRAARTHAGPSPPPR